MMESKILVANVDCGGNYHPRYYLVDESAITRAIRSMLDDPADHVEECRAFLQGLGEPVGGLDRHGHPTRAHLTPPGMRIVEILTLFTGV